MDLVSDGFPATRSRPLRLDIVGCGAVVQQYHLPVIQLLQKQDDVAIAGTFDLNSATARRLSRLVGAERWGTQPSPAERDGVDAVLLATPPDTHAELAMQYIRSGKSVLVEKPLASTPAEAQMLVTESQARGVTTTVNHFWRFLRSVTIAREWLMQGGLGAISSIVATEGFRWNWAPASNYVTDHPHGGVIHDTGAHLVDTIVFLLGLDQGNETVGIEINDVRKIPSREPSHECRAQLTLHGSARDSIEVDLAMSRLQPLARGIKVRGSSGLLFVPTGFSPAPVLIQGESGFRLESTTRMPNPSKAVDCFLLTYQDFLRSVRGASVKSRVVAERFLLLTEILEYLWQPEGRG
jgi:predicted dehydrogenase